MSYRSTHTWRTGKEIDDYVDRTIFELQMKSYKWKKTLSIKPRRCYWDDAVILPFTYAMVAHPKLPFVEDPMGELRVHDDINRTHVFKWISMESYILLRLKGKI